MATALTAYHIQDTLPSEYRHELKPADAVDALRTILTSLAEIESIDDAQVFMIFNYLLSYFFFVGKLANLSFRISSVGY